MRQFLHFFASRQIRSFVGAIPWLFLILGLSMTVAGNAYNPENDPNGSGWALLEDIGLAVLTGGIFAVLIKSFQFLGVYREAISDIMLEDAFLKRLNDIDGIWRKVTGMITGRRFSELSHDLHTDLLEQYLPGKEDMYYENYTRACKVDWKPGSNTVLAMTEDAHLEIVPTSAAAEIDFNFSFYDSDGSGNLPDDASVLVLKELWIEGVKVVSDGDKVDGATIPCLVDTTVGTENDVYKCSVKLRGQDRYVVHRVMYREFKPTIDPIQRCFSSRFIKGARIIVQCVPQNLRVRFINLGTPRDFTRIVRDGAEHASRVGDIAREYPKLLFPMQGYALYFQVLDAQTLATLDETNETPHVDFSKSESGETA